MEWWGLLRHRVWQSVILSQVNLDSSQDKMCWTGRWHSALSVLRPITFTRTTIIFYAFPIRLMRAKCPALLTLLYLISSVIQTQKKRRNNKPVFSMLPTVRVSMPAITEVVKLLVVLWCKRDFGEGGHLYSVGENNCFYIIIYHFFFHYLSLSFLYFLSYFIPCSFPTCFYIGTPFPLPSFLSCTAGKYPGHLRIFALWAMWAEHVKPRSHSFAVRTRIAGTYVLSFVSMRQVTRLQRLCHGVLYCQNVSPFYKLYGTQNYWMALHRDIPYEVSHKSFKKQGKCCRNLRSHSQFWLSRNSHSWTNLCE
jgi:hypothetical protein